MRWLLRPILADFLKDRQPCAVLAIEFRGYIWILHENDTATAGGIGHLWCGSPRDGAPLKSGQRPVRGYLRASGRRGTLYRSAALDNVDIEKAPIALTDASYPLATVIICTRNRARSLARTLESLIVAAVRLEAQGGEPWELIVVDNGSSDDTVATIAAFAGRLSVRAVSQPVPGLSNARNAGVAAARGDFILWTDDDVILDPQWLNAWFRAFRARPNGAVFGGRTEPRFEEPRQEWFVAGQEHLGSLLAVRDADWSEVNLHQLPWGLNYAVRTTEQRRHLYDPELGVAPGRRRGGEEVAVIRAILAEGGTGSWVWDATVFHIIPAERQTEDYIDTYYQALANYIPVFGPSYGMMQRFITIFRTILGIGKLAFLLRTQILAGSNRVAGLVELARLRGSLSTYLRSPLHERRESRESRERR